MYHESMASKHIQNFSRRDIKYKKIILTSTVEQKNTSKFKKS